MAGGNLVKQGVFLTAKLNDVNDTAAGGAILSVPAGAPVPTTSQTFPGDRMVLDDAAALALSDTAVGTLYGGIYMYFGTLSSSTASPARGAAAFFRAADIPSAVTGLYQITADAQPSAAIPTLLAGVFINAITKGNFGWVQLCGIVSVLYDSTLAGTNAVGQPVSVKVSPVVASTFDAGQPLAATLVSAQQTMLTVGPAIITPVVSTVSTVLWQRSPFGRI